MHADAVPAPYNVQIADVSRDQFIFKWSTNSDNESTCYPNYTLSLSPQNSCGTCPILTTGTNATCEITPQRSGELCTLTILTNVCGNIRNMNARHITVMPKGNINYFRHIICTVFVIIPGFIAPSPPELNSSPQYANGKLARINTTLEYNMVC